MEKRIVIAMNPDRDIVVSINDETKLQINKTSRTISADILYHILDYSQGDTYTVETTNEPGLDIPVLDFFAELFADICQRINSFNTEVLEESSLSQNTEQVDLSFMDIPSIIDNTSQVETDELPF